MYIIRIDAAMFRLENENLNDLAGDKIKKSAQNYEW